MLKKIKESIIPALVGLGIYFFVSLKNNKKNNGTTKRKNAGENAD